MILSESRVGLTGPTQETRQDGSARGRAYTRTVIADACGVPHVEYWAIEGLGHAWSGGSPEGSHTDQHGARRVTRNATVLFGEPGTAPGEVILANCGTGWMPKDR